MKTRLGKYSNYIVCIHCVYSFWNCVKQFFFRALNYMNGFSFKKKKKKKWFHCKKHLYIKTLLTFDWRDDKLKFSKFQLSIQPKLRSLQCYPLSIRRSEDYFRLWSIYSAQIFFWSLPFLSTFWKYNVLWKETLGTYFFSLFKQSPTISIIGTSNNKNKNIKNYIQLLHFRLNL